LSRKRRVKMKRGPLPSQRPPLPDPFLTGSIC
jgi:hypothetical protein